PSTVASLGSEAPSDGTSAASSTYATTRGPAPIEYRISVAAGVRETIFAGSAAISTTVLSSSVTVVGKATGVGVGAVVGATVARDVAGAALGASVAAAEAQPATRKTVTRIADAAARGRRKPGDRMW